MHLCAQLNLKLGVETWSLMQPLLIRLTRYTYMLIHRGVPILYFAMMVCIVCTPSPVGIANFVLINPWDFIWKSNAAFETSLPLWLGELSPL